MIPLKLYMLLLGCKPPGKHIEQHDTPRLFFVNLGGYQENTFEEQHYNLLTLKVNRCAGFQEAKQTIFFRYKHFTGAESHIDDKYGIDVDDLYEIEEMLSPA